MIRQRWIDFACVLVGAVALIAYLRASPGPDLWDGLPDRAVARAVNISDMMLGVGSLGDVLQDVIGFRRMVEHRDPYPVLQDGARDLGLNMSWPHRSTHPPTAFLLAAPVAYLPLSLAGQAWIVLSLALLFLSALCYGVRWPVAFALAMIAGVVWGPVATAFQQVTLIWLAGVALAYRYRERRTLWAGVGVGVAALTKLLPLGILGYFLFSRKYRAALGCGVAWGCAVAAILLLEPNAFGAYLGAGSRQNTLAQILRADNISPVAQVYIRFGHWGLLPLAALGALLFWSNRAALFAPGRTPTYSFFLYSFLAILLLPICWSFSLAPLLPILGYFLVHGRTAHRLIASSCLVAFAVLPPFGQPFLNSLVLVAASSIFFLRLIRRTEDDVAREGRRSLIHVRRIRPFRVTRRVHVA